MAIYQSPPQEKWLQSSTSRMEIWRYNSFPPLFNPNDLLRKHTTCIYALISSLHFLFRLRLWRTIPNLEYFPLHVYFILITKISDNTGIRCQTLSFLGPIIELTQFQVFYKYANQSYT